MKLKLLSIVLLLSLPAFAAEVQTSKTQPDSIYQEDDPHPFAGLLTGAYTSKDANDSSAEFGVVGGYQLLPLAIGVEFSGAKYRDEGTLKDKTNLLLEPTYHLSGEDILRKYTYVGLGLGLVVRSSATDFAWAPMAGFDVPLGDKLTKHFSLGANVKYLFTNGTPTEGVAVNGALKYWF
jgi:hypothetical protein